MEFIFAFFIILMISSTLTIVLNKKIDQTIPISVMTMILIVYMFGIFKKLELGVRAIELVSILALCFFTKEIIKASKVKKIKQLMQNIVTPGLIVYVILYITFIFVNNKAIFTDHDEFTHWGIMIKNMFIYNSFEIKENSLIRFSEYPPFTAIFQYIFLILKANYSESTAIIASNILYLSVIITILNKIEWRKNLKMLIVYIPLIIFLPMICYLEFYKNILVDGILGVFLFYVIYIWYTEKDKRLRNICITLGGCSLVLIKLSGIGLCIMANLIIVGDILRKKENRKQKLKNIIITILIIFIFAMSWQINITNAQKQWDMSRINIDSIKKIPIDKEKLIIIDNYKNNVFNTNVISGKNITTFTVLIIIVIYGIFMGIYIKNKEEKIKYLYYHISLLIGCLLYIGILLLTYLYIIPRLEANLIPCYDRYMGSILLPIIMFCILIFIERKEKMKNSMILLIIVILLIVFPTKEIIQQAISREKNIMDNIEQRNYYSGIEKYADVLTDQDKIYFTGNNVMHLDLIRKINRYLVMPAKIENTSIYTTRNVVFWKEILKEEEYTHVYVFEVDDAYRERYNSIFENGEIRNKTMYKIGSDGILYEIER